MKRGYFQKVSPGVAPLGAGGSRHQEGLTALGAGASRSTPSSAAPGTWCRAKPTTTQAGVWALWRPRLAQPGPQPCPAPAPCPPQAGMWVGRLITVSVTSVLSSGTRAEGA